MEMESPEAWALLGNQPGFPSEPRAQSNLHTCRANTSKTARLLFPQIPHHSSVWIRAPLGESAFPNSSDRAGMIPPM